MLRLASVLLVLTVVPPRFRIEQRVTIREQTRADAAVCLVHLHGNEQNARTVMLELAKTSCANALWLDDALLGTAWQDDRIPVPNESTETHACSVNPNRILTPAAFDVRIANDCADDATARAELRRYLDETFLPALARCRGGDRRLPVVAFHNNSILLNQDMDAQRASNVAGREHDIMFVTRADDFAALAADGRFSVSLQNDPPADDGSLSVLLQRERYINVEAQIAPKNLTANRAMGELAVRTLGALTCRPAESPARPPVSLSPSGPRR